MTAPLVWARNQATAGAVTQHLQECADAFVPRLGTRVDIVDYAAKLVDHAERFEAWVGDVLVGFVAAYMNDPSRSVAFVSSVSVLRTHRGMGIASSLVMRCVDAARSQGFGSVELEVGANNLRAIGLYSKMGFQRQAGADETMRMHFDL